MGQIFGDLSFNRPRQTYAPLNIGYVDNLGAALEEDYTKNKTKAELLAGQLKNVKVRDVNRPQVNAVLDDTLSKINAIAERGDYENADLEISKLADSTARNPLLQAAVDDYNAYTGYEEGLSKLKDTNQDRIGQARQMSMATNQKAVEVDPVTGQVRNTFKGYTPVKTPDIGKIVGDFAKSIKESSEPVIVGKTKDGQPMYMRKENNTYYINGSKEGIDEEEAMNIITTQVMQNPEISAYVQEGAMLERHAKKFDPVTGEYNPYTVEDFGGEANFVNQLTQGGLNPDDYRTPEKLQDLYGKLYQQREASKYATPYAGAVSYQKIKQEFHKDDWGLNQQQANLAWENTRKKIAAEEGSAKRLAKFKFDLDNEGKEREKALMVLSNPVELESVNYSLKASESSLDKVNQDLSMLTQLKERSIKGEKDSSGQPITFSPAQNAQLQGLLADQRRLQIEKDYYLNAAVNTDEGKKALEKQYQNYVSKTGNNEKVTLEQFIDKVKKGDIGKPKMVDVQVAPAQLGGMYNPANFTRNDPNDLNTYLLNAKNALAEQTDIQKKTNESLKTLDANGLFSIHDGSGNLEKDTKDKSDTVYKVTSLLTKNVLAQQGVGYDLIGSNKRLNDVLAGFKLDAGSEDEGEYKGKKVKIQMVPLDRTQQGQGYGETMYQFIMRDPVNGKTIMSSRVRPRDQRSHGDVMYNMNSDLVAGFDENTEIGRHARMNVINHEFPQFKIGENKEILDRQIGKDTPGRSGIGIGSIIPVGQQNWTFVKHITPVVDHFDKGDPNRPVTVNQETYHLVKLKDGIAPTTQIKNEDDLKKYAYADDVFGSGLPNPRHTSDEKLTAYAAKNKDFLTAFQSLEDAQKVFYEKVAGGKYNQK
jgi:hypothetical protein